jgi:hypothetical protein
MYEMAMMKAVPVAGTTVPGSHVTVPRAHAGAAGDRSRVSAPATGHASATHTTHATVATAVTVCDCERGQQYDC